MTNLQMYPVIIPYDSGNGAPITDKEIKLFIGVWIVLNVLWMISLVVRGIKYLVNKKRNDSSIDTVFGSFFDRINLLDFIIIVIWGFITLIGIGYFVSKFL